MDKKNTTIGVLLLIAAFGSYFYTLRNTPPPAPPAPAAASPTANPATTPSAVTPAGAPGVTAPEATTPPAVPTLTASTFAALATENTDASIVTLSNDFIEVRLTNFGGAIRDVAIKKYPAVQGAVGPFVFNQLHAAPILALGDFPGIDQTTRFALVSQSPTEAVYRATVGNTEVTRRYTVRAGNDKGDPYRVRHETTFRNLTAAAVKLPAASLNLGTAALINNADPGTYLNVVTFNGEDAEFTDRSELEGGGFLSWFGLANNPPKAVIEKPSALKWASVKNQFFASILTLDKPGSGVVVRRVELPPFPGSAVTNVGITGAARLAESVLAENGSSTVGAELYVGPKEYTRLAEFEHSEDKVMQFDRYFFNRIFLSGVVAPLMNKLMVSIHNFVGDWGWAIVLMTLILKFISLPFTLAASKSAKRMQKLQPQMQAIREKYKDNPTKLNQATMQIFKENKVNPVGGCLPILITIPLFVGFFAMLQGTAELRFQSFLWAHDLAAPDTVARIFGFPLNIMPLLMGATMIYQMKLTPQPSIDNAQAKIFKFMPFFFTAICYNFAAALALYSTINGLFTIVQQLLVNKFSKDEPVAASPSVPAARSGKTIKNVTPKKK